MAGQQRRLHDCERAKAPARVLPRGFTLVEVLVALFIMSILAVLSWRALDGMTRVQNIVVGHSDQTLALQAGLRQWSDDLDNLQETGLYNAVDYDGGKLRITRRAPTPSLGRLLVVAWALHAGPDGTSWQRWVSQPLSTRGELRQAWQNAADWAQSSGLSANGDSPGTQQATSIAPATDLQVFFYRNNAWTNPLSSADAVTEARSGTATSHTEIAIVPNLQAPPDGVRLALTLANSANGLQGQIMRDWIRATVGGSS